MSGGESLLVASALAAAALLAGRVLVAGLGADLLRRFDAPAAAASLVLGAAILTLLSVGLSGLGLPTPDMAPLVPAILLLALTLGWTRSRLDALRPRGSTREWLALAVPLALTLVVSHLPVLRTGGFAIGNDTYTYSAFSEWLQRHGFSEAARWDPMSPVTGIPALWQSQHYDLGIAHLLALVQAATAAPVATLAYPATAALGMALVAAAVFLAARTLLRFGSLCAGAIATLFAVTPHPLYWGHHNGFLQQTYALAVVVSGLVLLTRAARPGRHSAGNAVLVALHFVFLLIVYLPLLPALALVGALAAVHAYRRAARHGTARRLAAFAAVAAALFLALGLRDLVGVVLRMRNFMTDVAGGHVPWTALQFFQFAMGTRVLAPGYELVESPPFTAMNRWLAPAVLALALAGLATALRRERSRGLALLGALFGAAILYFGFVASDPWKHTRGHTWNVLKLAQWSYPVLLLLAAAGLRALAVRLGPRARAASFAIALALPLSLAGAHWEWSRRLGLTMREILPAPEPLRALSDLKRRIQELPPGTLVVVGRPANVNRWLAAYTGLLAYPRAVIGDWTDSASLSNHPVGGHELYEQVLGRVDDLRLTPIVAGFEAFDPRGAALLGAGYARLDQPVALRVIHVVNPAGIASDPGTGRPAFAIGEGRSKVVVYAPAPTRTELRLELRPYRGRPGTRLAAWVAGGDYSHRSVRLASEGAPAAAAPLGGETSLRLPLELPRGLATVVLVVDEGRGERDARDPVTVVGLALDPAATNAAEIRTGRRARVPRDGP